MTRKDYVAFAKAIAERRQDALFLVNGATRLDQMEATALLAASVFAADNPRFNRQRFLTACGVSE